MNTNWDISKQKNFNQKGTDGRPDGRKSQSLCLSSLTWVDKRGKIANLANLPKFWKIIKFSKYGALTYIITLVIPSFRPFRSISYRFRDSMFWPKKFWPNFFKLVLLGQYFSGHFQNLISLLYSYFKQCVKFTEQNNEWFGWKRLNENT